VRSRLAEQAEAKMQWLMNESYRQTIEAATPADAATQTTTSTTAEATTTKKGVNKKIIQSHINETITQMGYTCSAPLVPINMVGIVLNERVLCTRCGLMTRYTNENVTDTEILCSAHRDQLFQQQFQKHHTALTQHHQSLLMDPGSLGGGGSGGNKRQKQSLRLTLHPLDICAVPLPMTATTQQAHIETTRCACCRHAHSRCRVQVMGAFFQIISVSLCLQCYNVYKQLYARHTLPPLRVVYTALKGRL
jgi:hypothetical protein